MLTKLNKAPYPWFGGKSQAAPVVWAALGDVDHYVEPFAGSLAVLLERPHPCNRTYHSETVNDLDGLLVNAWRAIQWHPEETAEHASWPVSEVDKQARQIAVLRWHDERVVDLLAGSAEWCDPRMAGWWLYGVCCQIGAFAGDGPWTADPVSGRIVKQGRDSSREPGVFRDRPHLANNGQGVNRPQLREPGILSDLPDNEFHPQTMPELVRWFQWLSARFRHVRIVNGDWQRVCTSGAMFTIPVRQGAGVCGVFLDPPYTTGERTDGLYAHDDVDDLPGQVRDWCIEWGDDPRCRIVLAGYDSEHSVLVAHGWREIDWYRQGWLTGGMGNTSQQVEGQSHQQHRERLWLSPHCLTAETQGSLFDAG